MCLTVSEVLLVCTKMACDAVASDKEHDFVRLVTDFVGQLGLQLNVSKLVEVGLCTLLSMIRNL